MGLKSKRLEEEMYQIIAGELKEREEEQERVRQQRRFETTTNSTHAAFSLTENTVGRWLMKTQDGAPIVVDKAATRGY